MQTTAGHIGEPEPVPLPMSQHFGPPPEIRKKLKCHCWCFVFLLMVQLLITMHTCHKVNEISNYLMGDDDDSHNHAYGGRDNHDGHHGPGDHHDGGMHHRGHSSSSESFDDETVVDPGFNPRPPQDPMLPDLQGLLNQFCPGFCNGFCGLNANAAVDCITACNGKCESLLMDVSILQPDTPAVTGEVVPDEPVVEERDDTYGGGFQPPHRLMKEKLLRRFPRHF
jgi:hypothetical protein